MATTAVVASPSPPPPEAILHLRAALFFVLATFIMLIYDHLITLDQEVERIWKRQFSGATALFLFNRYFSPLQATVGVVSFLSPAWANNRSACLHYYRFEAGTTLAIIAVCELILMLRVYALWGKNRYILILLGIVWITQVVLSGNAMVHTTTVPLPPHVPGCIETGIGPLWTPFWVMPLVSDTIVFLLTLWKTQMHAKTNRGKRTPLIERFRRDGVMYFLCIFGANLLNTLFFLYAVEDLKAIGAGFSQALTTVMVSRLVLNLRGVDTVVTSRGPSRVRSPEISHTLIGNLGAEIDLGKREDAEGDTVELQVLPYLSR